MPPSLFGTMVLDTRLSLPDVSLLHRSHAAFLPPPQGFTPDKLPPSSCVMVPELHPPSPAKKFFTKMAKSFFGKKKAKGNVTQPSSDFIQSFIESSLSSVRSFPSTRQSGNVVMFPSTPRRCRCSYGIFVVTTMRKPCVCSGEDPMRGKR